MRVFLLGWRMRECGRSLCCSPAGPGATPVDAIRPAALARHDKKCVCHELCAHTRVTAAAGASFGGVVSDAAAEYAPNDTARAAFHSACPRNNVRRGGTFLAVERRDEAGGAWRTVCALCAGCRVLMFHQLMPGSGLSTRMCTLAQRWACADCCMLVDALMSALG